MSRPQKGKTEGDVHVGSMAAEVPGVPGSRTTEGRKAITAQMREVLDRAQNGARDEAASDGSESRKS